MYRADNFAMSCILILLFPPRPESIAACPLGVAKGHILTWPITSRYVSCFQPGVPPQRGREPFLGVVSRYFVYAAVLHLLYSSF